MFYLNDFSRFDSDNIVSKILKPAWKVVGDYCISALLGISLFVGGVVVISESFHCVPAIDCPSKGNAMLLPRDASQNVCSSLDREGKTTLFVSKEYSLQYAQFINSECYKQNVSFSYTHISLILFAEALILLMLDNIWLKIPVTASILEIFSVLVKQCYDSPGTDIGLSQVLTENKNDDNNRDNTATKKYKGKGEDGIQLIDNQPTTSKAANSHQQEDKTTSKSNNVKFINDATGIAAETLYEQVKRFKKRTESSNTIAKWYRSIACIQMISAIIFLGVNIGLFVYLERKIGKVNCSIDEYVPLVRGYFICSYKIAPVFKTTLGVFSGFLAICIGICVFTVWWSSDKNVYNFKEQFKNIKWIDFKIVLGPAKNDLAFLMHLLHAYNDLYTIRFAFYMSEDSGFEKALKRYFLDKKWTKEELEKKCDESDKTKLELSNLEGVPLMIYKLNTLNKLKLISCGPLDDIDFERLASLFWLKKLYFDGCGLRKIPDSVLSIKSLEKVKLDGVKTYLKSNI